MKRLCSARMESRYSSALSRVRGRTPALAVPSRRSARAARSSVEKACYLSGRGRSRRPREMQQEVAVRAAPVSLGVARGAGDQLVDLLVCQSEVADQRVAVAGKAGDEIVESTAAPLPRGQDSAHSIGCGWRARGASATIERLRTYWLQSA